MGYGREVDQFEVIDVSAWPVLENETAGQDAKLWLTDVRAEAGQPSRAWLFKPVTRHSTWAQDDHWAERIASATAEVLGVPCARYELATRNGVAGIVSETFAPSGWQTQPGAVLLSGLDRTFRPRQPGAAGHSLVSIKRALDGYAAPLGFDFPPAWQAYDAFVGMIVLDALISNRDRHEGNWSVVFDPLESDPGRLAPAYDHGRSFAANLQDRRRLLMLERSSVAAWLDAGTAHRFEHDPAQPIPTLVDLANAALASAAPATRRYWLDRLAQVPEDLGDAIVARIPKVSDAWAKFVPVVLATNRRRILDAR